MLIKIINKAKLLQAKLQFNFTSSSSFNPSKDYFQALNLTSNATQAQIKSAYYELAKKYHPDLNKGQQTRFKQINEAYTVLSNEKTKREYEMARDSPRNTSQNRAQSGRYQQPFGGGYQGYYGRKQGGFGEYTDYTSNPFAGFKQNYQDPFFSSPFRSNPYQSNESFRENRQFYENNYDIFMKMRRAQQQMREQYQKNHSYKNNPNYNQEDHLPPLNQTFRTFIILTVFFTLMFLFSKPQPQIDQGHLHNGGYRIATINGNPYMQNERFIGGVGMYDGKQRVY